MLQLVVPTLNEKPLLDAMAQLYSYDFSEITHRAIGQDGLFPEISCFSAMWTDPSRYPHVIMVDQEPAGFAIVQRTGDQAFDMEQFFVLRKFRRSGIGTRAAQDLFSTFPGQWTVGQIAANTAAQAFWRGVISGYTKGDFQDTAAGDPVQSFQS